MQIIFIISYIASDILLYICVFAYGISLYGIYLISVIAPMDILFELKFYYGKNYDVTLKQIDTVSGLYYVILTFNRIKYTLSCHFIHLRNKNFKLSALQFNTILQKLYRLNQAQSVDLKSLGQFE